MIFYHRYEVKKEIEMNLVADGMLFYLINAHIYFTLHSYTVELDESVKVTLIDCRRKW